MGTMSSTKNAPTAPVTPEEARESALGLSATQIAASALAAVSSAVLGSWLGVTGTLLGAAFGSVVGTVGSATYTYTLSRGGQVVRSALPLGRDRLADRTSPADPNRLLPSEPAAAQTRVLAAAAGQPWYRALPWPRIALGAATVMVLAVGALTVFEGLAGKPVSAFATGDGARGTTLGQVVDQDPGQPPTEEPVVTDPEDAVEEPEPEPVTPEPTPTDEPTTDEPSTDEPTTDPPADDPTTPTDPSPTETTDPEGAGEGGADSGGTGTLSTEDGTATGDGL